MRTLMLASAATLALAAVSAKAETVAIVHAHLLTMGKAGAVDGTLVIKDGQIAAVGADVAPPAGARIIDAKGAVVTPGLISTDTAIGAVEVEGVRETRDEGTSAPTLGAAFDVQYSLDPDSLLIPIVRATGVTRAVATPVLGGGHGGADEEGDSRDFTAGAESGGFAGRGLFAGQAAVIHLGQGTDILAKPHAAMVAELGETGAGRVGGGKAAAYQTLKGALDDARHFAKNRAAYDKNAARPYSLSREDLEALIPVVEGKEPLLIAVHRAADIRLVLKLAREEKIKVILDGAEEGWRVASEIAAAHAPVVLDGEADLPASFESRGAALENGARLNAAGVSVAIHGPSLFTGGARLRDHQPGADVRRGGQGGQPRCGQGCRCGDLVRRSAGDDFSPHGGVREGRGAVPAQPRPRTARPLSEAGRASGLHTVEHFPKSGSRFSDQKML